jgi:hypothetical protein
VCSGWAQNLRASSPHRRAPSLAAHRSVLLNLHPAPPPHAKLRRESSPHAKLRREPSDLHERHDLSAPLRREPSDLHERHDLNAHHAKRVSHESDVSAARQRQR